MTTGEFLISVSSLSTGSSLQHLMSITSGGGITWLPAQSIDADMSQMTLSVDFIPQDIDANINTQSFSANLLSDNYSASVVQNNIQGDLSCK